MKGVTNNHVATMVAGLAANPEFYKSIQFRTRDEVATQLTAIFRRVSAMLVDDQDDSPESPNTERQNESPHDPLEP
jgi:hypothetical protein